jgi:hypothetical protein
MKIGNFSRVSPTDTPEQMAMKVNKFMIGVEQALNNGLDFVNNHKGSEKNLTVQNGVPLVIPSNASLVMFLKVAALSGSFAEPTYFWRPVSGGLEITVTWTGSATTAEVNLFVGEK